MQLKDHIEGNKSHSGGQTEAIYEIPAGSLDGYTLFRFAHMFRGPHSGGMETYLGDLNRRLLERNALRILQLYLATAEEPSEIETQKIGRGELVWIPSFIKTELTSTRAQRFWKKLKRCLFLDEVVNHDILLNKLESYMINLAVFHWISDDSAIVLNYLKDRKIPFVLINHFQNERLGRPSAKNYISEASGIAGVSNVDVPAGLETKFTNLSDGIDTNFFHPKMAVPLPTNPEKPVILLPSRITEGKGHIDAIKALGWLRKQKVSCCMVFAGPIENPVLMKNLMQLISEEGVQGMVFFNGKLSSEELRNWYSASDIVLLASYSEGLGRVLLEAQAMERPVVAYSAGGITEAIQHGEGGYLVSTGDYQLLAHRLKELLADDEKRYSMGKRGRIFVLERFNINNLVVRHEDFYCKATRLSNNYNYTK